MDEQLKAYALPIKALSLSRLALAMIHRRGRQYRVLALGIFLAVYFAATMLLIGSSVPQTLKALHMEQKGGQDLVLFNIGEAPLDELVKAGVVSDYGVTEILAELKPRLMKRSSAFSLARFDKKALQITGKRLIAGRLPQQAGEIALEQETLSLERIIASPGELIQLQVQIPDGTDYLAEPVTREYLLTGILADQRLNLLSEVYQSHFAYRDFPAAILSDAEVIDVGGRAIRTAYVKLMPGIGEADTRLQEFLQKHDIKYQWTAFGGLSDVFGGNMEANDIRSLLGFALFMAMVLLFAACLGIVNALSSNLQQRRQQIGMLRAVGATKHQIRQIFGREALMLSVLTIPLALAFGCLTVFSLMRLLGPMFIFQPQPLVLAVIAVFSVGCVWLAIRMPLRHAARIPPMQAVRDMDLSRRMRKRNIRSQKRFRMPRLLAVRNLKLYSSRLPGITLLLILSLVLVMVVPFFLEGWMQRSLSFNKADFVVEKSGRSGMIQYQYPTSFLKDGDIADLAGLPGVSMVDARKELFLNLLVSQADDYFTLGGFNSDNNYLHSPTDSNVFQRSQSAIQDYQYIKSHYGYTGEFLKVRLQAWGDKLLQKLQTDVYEGSIRPDRIASGEEILLVAPPAIQVSLQKQGDVIGEVSTKPLSSANQADKPRAGKQILVFENDQFHAGDQITLSLLYSQTPPVPSGSGINAPAQDVVRIDRKVTIGALLRPSAQSTPGIDVMPLTSIEGLAALGFEAPYSNLRVHLETKPDPALEDYLIGQIKMIANRADGYQMSPWTGLAEKIRRDNSLQLLETVGIMVVLFAVITSMVINNLTARIRTSQRQIGMMRAVGATERDILHAFDLQILGQFAAGIVLGCLAGWAACLWAKSSSPIDVPWPALPVWQPLLFISLLVLVCRLNVLHQIHQINKRSIVENIREL